MEHGSVVTRPGQVFDFGLLHLEWTTALFILVVFVITMFLLNTLLFKPIIRTLEARQAGIDKNNDKVKGVNETVESSEKNYQEKLADVNTKIQASRLEALKIAKEEANKILEQVKASTSEKLDAAGKELADDQKKAMENVAGLSDELAQIINAKVLA
ncbi:ATP synthase F0 subunit B [Candidatus Falkowbacteria bacterium]|jgi:F-type H+-transporting ATPase subunit b|nr:ATP synthase F0 subunit B [Deltaproteobacteria bacterium]MBT5503676.1 ATP synthase F0 subunit B [Candidatus Falkowbacteria bacterium]